MLDGDIIRRAKAAVGEERFSEAVNLLDSVQVERLTRDEVSEIRRLFDSLPEEQRAASPLHCVQEIQLCQLTGRTDEIQKWYNCVVAMRDSGRDGEQGRSLLERCVSYAGMLRPMTSNATMMLLMAVIFNERGEGERSETFLSVTGKRPSIIHGRKDLSDWCAHYGAVTSIVGPMLAGNRGDGAKGIVGCARGEMFYERNDLNAATMENAAALSAEDPEVLFAGYTLLAKLYSLDPYAQSYVRVLEHIGKVLEDRGADWLLPNYRALRVRFSLLEGGTEQAEEWLAGAVSEWDGVTSETYYEMATKARVYIALGRYREAMSLLEQLLRFLECDIRPFDQAECLVHAAVACDRLGSGKQAMEKLDQALRMMEPFGFIRVFADCGTPMLHLLLRYAKETPLQGMFGKYVARITEAAKGFSLRWPAYFSEGVQEGQAGAPPDFTATETQILHLLGEGKSNSEIADELAVKLPTVKFHLKNIYEKMGVSSRTAALSAAKKRNIL